MRTLSLVAIWLSVAAASAAQRDKSSKADLSVSANTVLISAVVVDGAERAVRTLHREDFHLYESGREQKVTFFGQEELPVSLAVVFDNSGSMKGSITSTARAVAALLNLSNTDDEFCLIRFSGRAQVAATWTHDLAEIQQATAFVSAKGQTSLLDAIHLALEQLNSARNTRRAIVVFSDGGDNHSRYTRHEILSSFREVDVQLYAIEVVTAATIRDRMVEPEVADGPSTLEKLCGGGRGRFLSVENEKDLPATARRVSEEIHSQYILGFTPEDLAENGVYHKVRVKVSHPPGKPRLTVFWRQGYYAPRP